MRALPSRVFASAILLGAAIAAIAACSSNDPLAAGAGGDAGPDANAVETKDPGPPDAAALGRDASSSDASDAAFNGPTLALPAAADALGAAQCAFLERCFTEYTNQYAGSLAGCTTGDATQLRGDYPSAALFDTAAIDATVSCYAALSCGALYTSLGEATCPTPKPVNGAPVGASCNEHVDCASSFCSGASGAACGTCAVSTTVSLGDSCSDSTGKRCPTGAVCHGTCVIELAPGEACTAPGATPPTSVCASSLPCVAGVCTKSGGPGTSCTSSGKCDTFQLQSCDAAAGQCAAIVFLASGDACKVGDDGHMCGGGMRCIAPAGVTMGTCQTAAQPGQACVRSSSCTFGYDCKGNVCTAAGATRPTCH